VESCLYEGRVRHSRRRPVDHAFEFPIYMVYLDLEELPEVFRDRWLWSAERPAFAWFRRQDHFGDPRLPLDGCVRDLVEQRTGRRPLGAVRLLTHLRYAGYVINPVSFFYCFGEADERLEAIVAEVTNTPWGERHCYVLDPGPSCERSGKIRLRTPKEFHVSPFMGMQLVYDWTLAEPGHHLELQIANCEDGGAPLFEAALSMERREIDGWSLARVLLRHPFITLQVAAAIYRQALRLRLKGAPFHSHPRAGEALMETSS
jgi:DUF1365 family protein